MEWTPSQLEQAARLTRRLMGPKVAGVKLQYVLALEDLSCGVFVAVDDNGNAKSEDTGKFDGITVNEILQGKYGFVKVV